MLDGFQCAGCGHQVEHVSERDFDYKEASEELGFEDLHCSGCLLTESLRQDTLRTLEDRAGLTDQHRQALRSLVEFAVENPEKVFNVERLHQRVGGLEKQVNFLKWGIGIALAIVSISLVVVSIALTVVTLQTA